MHAENKNTVRQLTKQRIDAMTDGERRFESVTICDRLWSKVTGAHDLCIAIFMPLNTEPNIVPFIEKCLEEKITICAPVWEYPGLTFRIIQSVHDLAENPHTKIAEPTERSPLIDPKMISHALVPGRAFTQIGQRLGRGGGAYDRWISLQRTINLSTRFIGVCFRCQIVDELPMEEHDEKMDEVVTG